MAINLSELRNKSAVNAQNRANNQKTNTASTASSSFNNNMGVNQSRNINDNPFINSQQDVNRTSNINNANTQPYVSDPNIDLLQRDPMINNIPNANAHIGHDFIVNSNPYAKVEEKVAHLSLQANQIIIRPYLQQALDYLKNSKIDAINAYNQLSDEIANEVKIISQNTNLISNRLREAKDVINRTQEVIRNRYNNATEEEIASCALNLDYEYNIVAEHYELTLQLSQELAKYKSRIDTLLASQNLLDESIIPSISRIQLEIDNLQLLLHSLDSSDYANIIAKKTGRNISNLNYNQAPMVGRVKDLNNLVEQTGVYNYNNLNPSSTPNIASMNRYEDPTTSINISKTPINPNNNGSNLNSNSFNNDRVNNSYNNSSSFSNNNGNGNNPNNNSNYNQQVNPSMPTNEYLRRIDEETRRIAEAQKRIDQIRNELNNQQATGNVNNNNTQNQQDAQPQVNQQQVNYGPLPMTRREMRLQRKLQRQQMKMNAKNAQYQNQVNPSHSNPMVSDDFKIQNMQQQYSDNLAAMQKIQASNINIQNDLVQMQQERQLRLQEQMQQQFANMMQQQQMQQQMVQQFYQSMQQPVLNVGMTMTNPTNMTYPVYQTVTPTNIVTPISSTTTPASRVQTSTVTPTSSTSTPNTTTSSQQPTTENKENTVIEKQMRIDTLEENLAKSPRDKIFVVRSADPIEGNEAKKINGMKNLHTIKVIK